MTDSDQALAAHLQLTVAVEQLIAPSTQALDRSRPEVDHQVADVAAEADSDYKARAQRLRDAYTRATGRGGRGQAAASRALAALIALTREHQRRLDATAAGEATIPSLLDQLVDAAESSRGAGAGRAGVHRSPTNLRATELLRDIEHTVGRRDLPMLARRLTAWAADVAHTEPGALAQHAQHAEHWVAEAREIVTPDRSFELAGRCPLCGSRYAWVLDDTGTRVRRAALQVHYATRSASCTAPGCAGYWPATLLDHLARVVQQDRDETTTLASPPPPARTT